MSRGREEAPASAVEAPDGGETPAGGPLIIGHRGASAFAPENTHAAFRMAFDEAVDGIEFDVRLARDGVPVVIHDATLERTALIPGEVEECTSAMLTGCRVGRWFNLRRPKHAQESFADERIPTLAEVFESYGSRLLYVEMKCEDASRRSALARAVVELTRAHGLADRVVVKSFEHDSLAEVKRLAPEIRTAALFGRSWPRPLVPAAHIFDAAERCGADEISLHRSLLRKATAEGARRRGFGVLVWTVNSPFWLRRAYALGLRAVFTDCPAEMHNWFMQHLPGDAGRRAKR
ncbi:MAG TPA: glycerophosphodiester phosphodiesterase family protein [Pyrinomonadaceae bacterium]|jgi:glycerophosphoryl diester phosphodiesterase